MVKKVCIVFIFILNSLFTSSLAELKNLEIIWEKSYSWEKDSIAEFGRAISTAGDINGDGYDDIIIGAKAVSMPDSSWLSKAFVFLGGNNMDTIPDMILTGPLFGGNMVCVSTAGDINADGYDDLIFGQDGSSIAVRIFYGSPIIDTIPDLTLSYRAGATTELSCTYAGDVNGDGYDDLVFGDDAYNLTTGRVHIYFGGPDVDTFPDVTLYGGHEGKRENFGNTVGGNGDVDNDGFSDILVGAFGWWRIHELLPEGRIYLYKGGDPMDTTADMWMTGEGMDQHLGGFGVSFTLGGNNDIYHDIITSTAFWPNGFLNPPNPGKVYVLFGGPSLDSIPDIWMIGRTEWTGLGICVCGTGRIIEDGCEEGILAGAPYLESIDRGIGYLWLGGSPMDTTPDAWMRGEYPEHEPGWNMAPAGDVDGDGLNEIMISNYATDSSKKTVWICKLDMKIGIVDSLTAFGGDGFVKLSWTARPNEHTQGCNLYRSFTPDTSSWIKLNSSLTPCDSFNVFADRDVINDSTYYYWIAIVGYLGKSKLYGPESATPLDLILSSFTVTEGSNRYVCIDWQTEQEPDFLGWNIYRSESKKPLPDSEDKRNASLISSGKFDYHWSDCGVEDGVTYYYWLSAVNLMEEEEFFGPKEVSIVCFNLMQNRPNPFNSTTAIHYSLTEGKHTTMKIYNVAGELVRTLVDGQKDRGRHMTIWDGKNSRDKKLPCGIYFCRLEHGKFTATKKMLLIK